MNRIAWLAATGGNPMGFFDTLFSDFLGPAVAFGAGALFPEFAIPAEIAGGFGGGLVGGLIGGKSPGQAAIQGAETGAIAGVTGAIGQAAGVTPAGILSDIGIGSAPEAAATAALPAGSGISAVAPTAAPAALPTGAFAPQSAAGIAGAGAPTDIANFGLGGISDQALTQGNTTAVVGGGNPGAVGPGASGDITAAGATDPSLTQDFDIYGGGTNAGGGGVSGFISKNWPLLASAGILGVEAMHSNRPLPQEAQLQGQANAAQSQAAALEAPLQTGILPPGAKQAVDTATASQKAGITSTFANMGLAGSTMEAQALGSVDRNAAAQTFQIADQLLKSGIDLSKLSANELTVLLESTLKQDAQFGGALTTFAGGLAGGRLASGAAA